nr:hypothetical protein [bacterium]
MRVVIPSRLGGVMLDELLLALEGEGVSPKDVLVVRDGGDEWMESRLCPDPQGPTRRMGFAGAADWGIRHADAREVLLLNDDLLPEEGLIEGLNQIRDKAPFIGCRLLNFEGTVVEFDGGGMNALGFALSLGCGERPTEKRGGETLFASGAAVLLNAQACSSVGGYATGFFAYF